MEFKKGDKIREIETGDIGIVEKVDGKKVWCYWHGEGSYMQWLFKNQLELVEKMDKIVKVYGIVKFLEGIK